MKGNSIMQKYKREQQGDNKGFIFKSYDNFKKGDEICYIAEYAYNGIIVDETSVFLDESFGYTRHDLEKLCEGTPIDVELLFDLLDWQSAETLLDELIHNEREELE